jgi:hypothetical protein
VRQEVLKLDGHRCQICGYDGRSEEFRPWVVPHHGAGDHPKMGMGGAPSHDDPEGCVSLCSTAQGLGLPPSRGTFFGLANEGSCHDLVERGVVSIPVWDRGAGLFEVLDVERRQVPHERLWFYRRRLAEELEPVEARVQGLHRIDGDVARDVWRLCAGDAWRSLDPDSRSWKEYCGARGWDTAKATRLAKRWGDGKAFGLEWSSGETEAEYAKRLKAAGGDKEDRAFFYAQIPAVAVTWHRTANEEALRDKMQPGDVLVKVGKVVYGARAEDGKLFGPDGAEIAVERSA